MVPGDGAIDFAATVQAIRAMNYQGWITVELYPYIEDPDKAASRAISYVKPLLAQL